MTSEEVVNENGLRRNSPVIIAKPGSVQVIGGHSSTTGGRRIWVDGGVVLDGEAIWQSSDLSSHRNASKFPLETGTIDEIASWWMGEARGAGALFILDEPGRWAACIPDPLASAIPFYQRTKVGVYVSTDAAALRQVAEDDRAPLTKSAAFQAERMIFGNGGLVHSSFDDVRAPDLGEYLLVHEGRLSINQCNALDHLSSMPIRDLFELSRDNIIENVRAVASGTYSNRTCHLTGGFDSRLVLAALKYLGNEGEYNYLCTGPTGGPDQTVFNGLASTFSLRRASGNPLTVAEALPGVEQRIAPLFNSSGIVPFCPAGHEGHVDSLVLGGGYGGVMRTVYGDRPISLDGKTVDQSVAASSFHLDKASYLTPGARDWLTDQLSSRLTQLRDRYDLDFAADAYYSHGRSRYHFGQGAMQRNKVGKYFDPLYSPAVFFLASRVRQSIRQLNVVGYDMMESLSVDLLQYPFDSNKFSNLLTSMRKPAESKSFRTKGELKEVDVPRPAAVGESAARLALLRASEFWGDEYSAWSTENQWDARRYGVPSAQVRHLRAMRRLLDYSITVLRERNDARQVFDFTYLRELVRDYRPRKRQLRELNVAAPALFWLAAG